MTISAANTGDPEQIWKFIRQGDGSYCIQNMYSDWYLTYEGDCVQQAKVTVSWLNTNKASRFQWYIYDKNGTFQLVPKDSVTAGTWLVLDCTGNYQTAGTQMELYSNWSGPRRSSASIPWTIRSRPRLPKWRSRCRKWSLWARKLKSAGRRARFGKNMISENTV